MTDDAKPTIPTIEPITEEDAPKLDAPHRIVITFPTDHEINGMRVEIIGVTPEQCAVASYHVMRSANQLSDAIALNALRERREVEAVRQDIASGGRGLALPGRKGRN